MLQIFQSPMAQTELNELWHQSLSNGKRANYHTLCSLTSLIIFFNGNRKFNFIWRLLRRWTFVALTNLWIFLLIPDSVWSIWIFRCAWLFVPWIESNGVEALSERGIEVLKANRSIFNSLFKRPWAMECPTHDPSSPTWHDIEIDMTYPPPSCINGPPSRRAWLSVVLSWMEMTENAIVNGNCIPETLSEFVNKSHLPYFTLLMTIIFSSDADCLAWGTSDPVEWSWRWILPPKTYETSPISSSNRSTVRYL